MILPDGEWPIVGAFATGDLRDGELFGDTETVMLSVRHKTYNSVLVRLASPDGLAAFSRALKANPALNVDVMPLHEWNEKRSADFAPFFRIIVYGVGLLLAIGALFGCFNTMYSAVAARRSEIATLRALGYGGFPVAVSVILEAAALSVAGALIGAAFAWSRYDGVIDGFGGDIFKHDGVARHDRHGVVLGRRGRAAGRISAVHSRRAPSRGRSIKGDIGGGR